MPKKSSYKKVIHQEMCLSYCILYDMGVKKGNKLKKKFKETSRSPKSNNF